MDDSYHTIAQPAQIETKVKGSRFIGRTSLANSVDEALSQLEATRKREHAATHHCYAYLVGTGDNAAFKYSDDGEPSGTAGKPIYDTLCGHDVINALVVVTRYYGGTKLGTGGLLRAYSEAARLALEASGRKGHFLTAVFDVRIEFALYDQVQQLINRIGATQIDAQFSDHIELVLSIRRSLAERLQKELTELSSGRARIVRRED